MKGRIIGGVLLFAAILCGFFVPVSTGLTDDSMRPDAETLAALNDPSKDAASGSEDVSSESSAPAAPESEDTDSSRAPEAPDVNPDGLSDAGQWAYEWAATKAHPNDALMSPEQIHNWNGALRQVRPSVVDILNPPTALPEETMRQYLDEYELPGLPAYSKGQEIPVEEVNKASENRNRGAAFMPVSLGIVVYRASLRKFPTDTSFNKTPDDTHSDLMQIGALYCGMPVWILHTSSDAGWYYVQSYFARGWVHKDSVAVASSEEEWRRFAEPEQSLIITSAQEYLNGVTLDMGCSFPLAGESDGTFSFLLPGQDADGMLTFSREELPSSSVSAGYLDYTWTNFYTQVYKLIGSRFGQGDANGGVDEESLPGFLFRTFGFMLPRDLRDGSDTVGAPIDLSDLSEKDTETALSTLEYPSLLFTGDQVVIYLGEVDGVYHAVTLPQTEEEVCEIEFADTSDFRSVNALR